jgi:electron transport complex protein RnfB
MIMEILYSISVLGGLGFLFGGLLAFASQKFMVEINPKILEVQALLPGANCGGCGFPGCAGLACSIVENNTSPAKCPVASPENRKKIAELMGLSNDTDTQPQTALVRCHGSPGEEYEKYVYQGIRNCQAAVLLLQGPKQCVYRCIGMGSCKHACSFGAIVMGADDLPIIDEEKCVSCGKCVSACPKNLIKLVPKAKTVHVKCLNLDKGAETRKVCKIGCIGCMMCKKVCVYDAIIVENNLARIDYAKCVECGACVAKCPTKCIEIEKTTQFKPKVALVDEATCVGCTICFKVCKFEAVEGGTPKAKHRVLTDKCVGCGLCATKCPKKCISMVVKE